MHHKELSLFLVRLALIDYFRAGESRLRFVRAEASGVARPKDCLLSCDSGSTVFPRVENTAPFTARSPQGTPQLSKRHRRRTQRRGAEVPFWKPPPPPGYGHRRGCDFEREKGSSLLQSLLRWLSLEMTGHKGEGVLRCLFSARAPTPRARVRPVAQRSVDARKGAPGRADTTQYKF
ncbi:hypothetical protein SKAU_G00144590 [Synaphobranchus kaupii]|uniref:Uncharacterized protein n=1 Tax=Synaphobranchus kaupii TaxID=118154 RepID=A0A9Q1J4L4_SYNKA|nr:hypothetical protein SKAU_G00144590 [Synaphobranchus kaupii]